MVKEKGTEVQKEMSPILLDDSPKRPPPEPSPDFFWDHDILQFAGYLSLTEYCQQIPPQRPSTPPPPISTEMDFLQQIRGVHKYS